LKTAVAVRAKANSVRANPDKCASKGEHPQGYFLCDSEAFRISLTRRRAVDSQRQASGGNELSSLLLALPPVATRNGLAKTLRIGAPVTLVLSGFARTLLFAFEILTTLG
jgi:hypothetical protein